MKSFKEQLDSNFDLMSAVPSEEDIRHINEKKELFAAKGKNANYIDTPWGMKNSLKDLGKTFRYMFAAAFIGYDELFKELKSKLKSKGIDGNDIKKIVQNVNDNRYRFEKAINEIKNQTPQQQAQVQQQAQQNAQNQNQITNINVKAKPNGKFYRLVSYAPMGNGQLARRHIEFRNKDKSNGKYKLGIESATRMMPWAIDPLFDSIQQATEFAKNIINIPTTRSLSSFKFNISDKPLDNGVHDLSNCTLVDTIAGPAYMQNDCKYKESLEAKGNEKLDENLTRNEMIARLRDFGKNYRFDKYTDQQIFRIYQKAILAPVKTEEPIDTASNIDFDYCEKCGRKLTTSGECPVCDLGETDLDEDTKKIKDHKWVNKGDEGSHGTFTTKKAADAQRKAMFANGYHEGLFEDIEKHDTLNPKLWEDTNELKPEVERKINEIVKEFTDYLAEDNIKVNVKDIVLIGSNASYNYNEDSDLDVHIITDTESLDCPDNLYPALYSAYRSLFNKKFEIEFYGIPVELFVETEDTPTVSNGIYSVKNKKWIKEPVAEDIPEIDMDEFNNKYADWEEKCNDALADENTTTAKIDNLIEAIYDLRKNGLNTDGEYSIGNLVFKELRNNEFLDKLKDKKNEIRADELSLESLQEDTYGRYLTMKEIYEYREKIQRITRYQPIVQENKMFNIYNVKESDIRGIMARLRNEDFIDYVSETAGKFDFSHPKFGGMADRYYNIYGRIK